MQTRFVAEISIRVRKEEFAGHGWQRTSEGLSIEDSVNLGTTDFAELARIVGEFHALAERVRAERATVMLGESE